jgi:hypothetical protein
MADFLYMSRYCKYLKVAEKGKINVYDVAFVWRPMIG